MKDFEYSVLILGYKRPLQIERILTLCLDEGIKSIFVSIDGAVAHDLDGLTKNNEIRALISKYQELYPNRIRAHFNSENNGCASTMLSSLDWFFSHNNYGIILEDDCIPSSSFFKFAEVAEKYVTDVDDIWLACGTQFTPSELVDKEWTLSRYSLTWGWATSAHKWKLMRTAISECTPSKINITPSSAFWNSGARRALTGETDVWDTILVQALQESKKFAILPKKNLILNVGNDSVATHDQTHSSWTNRKPGNFAELDLESPTYSPVVDKWLKRHFFRIRFRHILTTQITRLFDSFSQKKKFDSPLVMRWNALMNGGSFD